ncbi:MAG: hypothetical protein R3F59_23835 [Myxococcota bacterium]
MTVRPSDIDEARPEGVAPVDHARALAAGRRPSRWRRRWWWRRTRWCTGGTRSSTSRWTGRRRRRTSGGWRGAGTR